MTPQVMTPQVMTPQVMTPQVMNPAVTTFQPKTPSGFNNSPGQQTQNPTSQNAEIAQLIPGHQQLLN